MGMIINIDKALELRSDYNILREPLNAMLQSQQEAWERKNPVDLLFNRGTISTFQETYTSSIGFEHAFAETGDYAVGPIFNTAEGFSATYRTRTFQGGFIITQQALEDRQLGRVKDDASAFIKRWHGDIVEYAMAAIASGFGTAVEWGSSANGGVSTLKLQSADTTTGELDGQKNYLFSTEHTVVKRKGMDATTFNNAKQSNLFRAEVAINDIGALADVINQVITVMENYKDDNNKRAGVLGAKTIVAPNNPHLVAALNTALSMDMFKDINGAQGINPAYKKATVESTPYLLDIAPCAEGKGFFIVDKAYNASNHGPEFTERVPLTLDVENTKKPKGISYEGRQRFDINVASWRGIAYVYIGAAGDGNWTKGTVITPAEPIAKPVKVVNADEIGA
jgi:hypothetical protein